MNTDLFKIAKADINKDFEQFKILLCFCITQFGSDLYIPMEYFRVQSKKRSDCAQFEKVLNEIRDNIFACRRLVESAKTLDEFKTFLDQCIVSIPCQMDNLIYLLACIPEEDKWLGKANVNKLVSGCLHSVLNETQGLIYFLKDTSKQLNKG